jgi:hypothetical protein
MRRLGSILAATFVVLAAPGPAAACSPPLNPTIAELGPQQVVVVGTIGDRVDGGRLFHVERAFNGVTATPIVIAFKEGEPIGDCSYPVHAGERLIIAPFRDPDGRLSADLGTLQAPPDSELGRQYLREAAELFGPGIVPDADAANDDPSVFASIAIAGALLLGLVVATAAVVRRRARDG